MINKNYKTLVEKILNEGYLYDDPNRKNVKRLEIPSYTFRHNFSDGFPAISTKKLAWKSIVTELIWFLKGDTNIKYLVDNNCHIWNKDAYNYYCKQFLRIHPGFKQNMFDLEHFVELIKTKDLNYLKNIQNLGNNYILGDLGKVYGHYWRNFDGVDQIAELIDNMINKPMSSELIVSARNPSHKDEQALPCCHYGFQIIMRPLSLTQRYKMLKESSLFKQFLKEQHIRIKNKTSENFKSEFLDKYFPKYGFELHWNQRSCDLFLGVNFNIASYALLALILEKITGHKALAIQGDLKKVHLYDNSVEAAKEQLSRKCSEEKVKLIIDSHSLETGTYINQIINNLMIGDFELENYNPQPAIKVEMLERDE